MPRDIIEQEQEDEVFETSSKEFAEFLKEYGVETSYVPLMDEDTKKEFQDLDRKRDLEARQAVRSEIRSALREEAKELLR